MSKLALYRLLFARDTQLPALLGGALLLGAIAAWYVLRPVDPTSTFMSSLYGLVGRYEMLMTWMIAAFALLNGIERTASDAADEWLHPIVARDDVRLTYLIACAASAAIVLAGLMTFGFAVQALMGGTLPEDTARIIAAVLVRAYAAALLGAVVVLLVRSKGLALLLIVAWMAIPAAALMSIVMSQSPAAVSDGIRTLMRWSPLPLLFDGPARFQASTRFAAAVTAMAILVAPLTVAHKS